MAIASRRCRPSLPTRKRSPPSASRRRPTAGRSGAALPTSTQETGTGDHGEAARLSGFSGTDGDGGNRTHVRDRVGLASTSVSGALISFPTRHAGGVVGNQPPEKVPSLAEANRRGL